MMMLVTVYTGGLQILYFVPFLFVFFPLPSGGEAADRAIAKLFIVVAL